MKKVIGNVGILDVRTTRVEALEEIDYVENAGLVICSEDNDEVIAKLSIHNMGTIFKVPGNCKLVNGGIQIDHAYLQGQDSDFVLAVNGGVKIMDDVTPEDIEKGIKALYVNGGISCPKAAISALKEKVMELNGGLKTEGDDEKTKQIDVYGEENIDAISLETLSKPARYVVYGTLRIIEPVEVSLFERIQEIEIYGRVIVREEYLRYIKQKITGPNRQAISVIPEGYEFLENSVNLDKAVLEHKYESARLFTCSLLRIEDDVDTNTLKKAVSSIRSSSVIICRSLLRDLVIELCETPIPSILQYSDQLIVIDDEHTLTKAELDYYPSTIAFFINGELTIDGDIDPEELHKKIEYIDSYGSIYVHDNAYAVIRPKLRTQAGEIINLDKKQESGEISYLVENAGYFRL